MGIPRRRLGTSGPEVSILSLGSWHTYDRMDFHDGVELIRRAVDAGINFFDVGVYGGIPIEPGGPIYHSYTDVIFGRLVEKAGVAREDYVLSEKLWLEPWPKFSMGQQLNRALYRVGTDHADFVVLGDIRTPGLDMHGLVEDLAEVVRSGALGAWGVNNWSADNIRRAHEIAEKESMPGPQMAQLKYSICRRSIADGEPFRELFEQAGISLQASDIFEGGILAGNLKPSRMIGRDPGGLREAIVDAGARVNAVAAELGVTPAQVSLAFCLGHPHLATILFGASRMGQLEENLVALDVFEREGATIRDRVAELWLDRDVVDPTGS